MEKPADRDEQSLLIKFFPVIEAHPIPDDQRNPDKVSSLEVRLIELVVGVGDCVVSKTSIRAPALDVLKATARLASAIGTGPKAIEMALPHETDMKVAYQLVLLGAADLYANTASFHGVVGSKDPSDPELGQLSSAFVQSVNRSMGIVVSWTLALLHTHGEDIEEVMQELIK
jgi:hypothetical protein